jgi:hypothetical protein
VNDRSRTFGLTVVEVAKRYRVSPDKVRAWVKSGQLAAVNTTATLCGKPRWVILPDALAAFERGRSPAPLPRRPRCRRRTWGKVDFYPD